MRTEIARSGPFTIPLLALRAIPLLVGLAACDEKESDAPTPPSEPVPSARHPLTREGLIRSRNALLDAGVVFPEGTSDAAPPWDGAMPPRPVPKSSPTVGSGMPMETQMQAIAYMAAMMQPKIDDAPADANYAQNLATQLKSIAMALDHGSADEKAKLNRVEVAAGGRKIDILLANGCDSETPRRAIVTRANTPLSTLLGHGVLVVRCNDAKVQCLQSTRDPTDVLCTTAPRHK